MHGDLIAFVFLSVLPFLVVLITVLGTRDRRVIVSHVDRAILYDRMVRWSASRGLKVSRQVRSERLLLDVTPATPYWDGGLLIVLLSVVPSAVPLIFGRYYFGEASASVLFPLIVGLLSSVLWFLLARGRAHYTIQEAQHGVFVVGELRGLNARIVHAELVRFLFAG